MFCQLVISNIAFAEIQLKDVDKQKSLPGKHIQTVS